MVVLLNHTSLYEPLFSQLFPWRFLWRFINNMAAPAASKTLDRPLVGFFWKMMIPHASSISRKRDATWVEFMNDIDHDSVVVIAPEGRMKRTDGLDKDGDRMNVKGGIADILAALNDGLLLIGYSGGLHHVQAPGETLPRPFKRIRMDLEVLDIAAYKASMPKEPRAFRLAVVADMQHRLETKLPSDGLD